MERVVDTRQSNPEMVTPFIRAGWSHHVLQSGDYQWEDVTGRLVLLEDKPVSKLVDDLQNGVLARQMAKLACSCDFGILLIRGSWIRDAGDQIIGTRSKMSWQAVWDYLEAIQRMGPGRISIQLATSTRHAVARIFELQEKYATSTFSSVTTKMPGDTYLQILCKIPGISIGKATTIACCFPNLSTLCHVTSYTDYEKIKGIGKQLAVNIWKFTHGDNR